MPGKSVCTLSALADPTIGWQATLSTPNAPPRPVKCAERLDVNFSPVCVCGGGSYPYPLPPIISIIIVTIITITITMITIITTQLEIQIYQIITIIIKIFCELFTGVCVGPIHFFISCTCMRVSDCVPAYICVLCFGKLYLRLHFWASISL